MGFIKKKSKKPTFSQRGLDGYIYPLKNKEVEIFFVNSRKGHDDFVVTDKMTHIYYVLDGQGIFTLNNRKHKARKDDFIEIPPGVEFAYTGKMKLLLIMNPPFDAKRIKRTRPNLK